MIGLRRALLALGVAGFGLGVILAVALSTSERIDHRGLEAALALVIGWGFIGAGLYAWLRRPHNTFGPLMTATGFFFFVSELGGANAPVVHGVCTLWGNFFLAVVVHMLLALPSGRLRTRSEQVLVVSTYVFLSPVSRSYALFRDTVPSNGVLVRDDPDLAHALDTITTCVAFVIFAVTLVFVWRHWRQANPAERRAQGPVLLTGATVLVLLEIGIAAELSGHATVAELGYYATQAAILPLPYAFLASLARSRLSRGDAVARLVSHLEQAPGQGEIRAALAHALADPSVTLAYWLPEFDTYADVEGHAVALADGNGDRATTLIGRNGHPIAALIHDPALRDEPGLLDAVTSAAAIALENVRLNVELRARLDELRSSRARIVEAGDAERRRLERNLHDGAQQRLVGVALQLRLLESRVAADPAAAELTAAAGRELAASLEELRELARGLHPAVLEHGLRPALEALAARSRIPTSVSCDVTGRLPAPVELAAYFVTSEALANVAKHAQATAVTVRAWRDDGMICVEIADDGIGGAHDAGGSGLRGLADRVEALDGRLGVVSPRGAGTVVTVRLPCAP